MYAELIKCLRDSALLTDADWRVEAVNDSACELMECTRAAFTGRVFNPLGGAEFASELELETFDGNLVTVEVQVLRRDDGEPGYFILLRDLSRQKATERKLSILDRVVHSSTNGVLIVDATRPELPLLYVNDTFERITGYSREEVIGRNVGFLHDGDRDQVALKRLREAIGAGRSCQVELRNYRKDGTQFWNALSISPVHDEQGRLTHFLGIQADITDQKRLEEERRFRDFHDPMTGLPNRELLEGAIENAISASDHDRKVAVLFMDIDHFKPINDSLGHRVGDEILGEVAQRLTDGVPRANSIGRVAGDEFVLLFSDIDDEARLLETVAAVMQVFEQPFAIPGEEYLYLTASLGISLLNGHNRSAEQLLQEADIAMYRSKQMGRNTWCFYREELNSNFREQVKLKSELQSALLNDEFFLEYQPQVDLLTGRLTGLEALIRWRHPALGVMSPGEFIPAAEQSGMIVPMGRWVMKEAARFNQELTRAGLCDVCMAVNISGLQFMRPDFIEEVKTVLEETGLPGNKLELELTESIMMESSRQALEKLAALKEMGVRIAIDDFGTGYSSLSYLKNLPVDTLKIDGSFVREVTESRSDAGIVLAIISIAHNLGISVIAEGIERHPQLTYLARNQCDQGQGFLISHPLPEEELKSYLSSSINNWLPFLDDTDSEQQTLLLVDDEPNILRALTRVLRRDGYNIIVADCARSALEKLAIHDVQVIISDQRMPEISGIELLSQVKEMYPDTVRIVLSGYTELETVTEAINRGAIYRFLTKPWEDDQLRRNVREAFQFYRNRFQECVVPPRQPGDGTHLSLVGRGNIN